MEVKTTANIRQTLTRRCAALGIPVSGVFELTPRCNLRCKMCYVRMTPEMMAPIGRERTSAEWLEIGKNARDAGLTFLLLTGGEPMLRTDFSEIYTGLTELGLSISVNTNGTLLTPGIREVWHRLPPAQVNVTLYGICREDYGNLCRNPDAFHAVLDSLDWLQAEGILVHLNTTMTPANQHRWLEIEKFAKDRGLELRMTTYCFPPVRRNACDECSDYSRLSPEAAARLAVQDIYYREGIESIRMRAERNDAPIQRSCELDIGEPIQCTAARAQFWLTWDGRMTPCGMLNTPSIQLSENGSDFATRWDSLRAEASQIRLCPDCTQCEDQATCLKCAAVTYSETGRFDGKPEYMCRFNKTYRACIAKLSNATV